MIEVKRTFANEQVLRALFTRTEIPVSVPTSNPSKPQNPAIQKPPTAASPPSSALASVPPKYPTP